MGLGFINIMMADVEGVEREGKLRMKLRLRALKEETKN